jgi:hypothetical protein
MLWTLEYLPLIMRALARAPYAYQMVGMDGYAPSHLDSQSNMLLLHHNPRKVVDRHGTAPCSQG